LRWAKGFRRPDGAGVSPVVFNKIENHKNEGIKRESEKKNRENKN